MQTHTCSTQQDYSLRLCVDAIAAVEHKYTRKDSLWSSLILFYLSRHCRYTYLHTILDVISSQLPALGLNLKLHQCATKSIPNANWMKQSQAQTIACNCIKSMTKIGWKCWPAQTATPHLTADSIKGLWNIDVPQTVPLFVQWYCMSTISSVDLKFVSSEWISRKTGSMCLSMQH